MKRSTSLVNQVLSVLMLLALLMGWVSIKPQPVNAATNTLTLNVISATDGTPVSTFKYLINIDNTGTTDQRLDPTTGALPYECTTADPSYPASCKWVSIAGAASSSPIYTQGDQSDFPLVNLPNGRYLISVLADGYRLDGAHFTVPMDGPVTVKLQPQGLPTATIQAEIFEDVSPTNSAPDVPAERGLAGFVGHIADYIGEVTTNVFGDPLCGSPGGCVSQCYVVSGGVDIGTVDPVDAAGRCPIGFTTAVDPLLTQDITQTREGTPIPAGAVVEGKLVIPDVGPNRYALSAIPPDGSTWIQTTTLEGNHDWDAWVMEGATGLDTEFVVAGEPFPAIFFGFVPPKNELTTPASGVIKGVVAATDVYIPTTSGLTPGGTIFGGMAGAKTDHPIDGPWIALADLQNGDTAVFVGQGAADGSFTINNVPDGDYILAYWDEPQDYILDLFNVTIRNGETVDLGVIPLAGWWTTIEGHVFNDLNANGKMDPGEPGLSNFPVAMKKRENSMMDRGAVTVTTDPNGYYFMENVYPMTQWLVVEAYSDLYYTTGVTYQADNQPTETTVLGQGVDVNLLPIIGLGGRLDWGVRPYDPGTNGGIVGTVSYDTTRNELDPRYAAVEAWQPGIPNLTVNLYTPLPCGTNPGMPCDDTRRYELAPDGSIAKNKLINTYVTETWERPKGCVARDVNGRPMVHGVDENVLPLDPNADCLEGPLMSVQFGPNPADGNFGATVDGNYGFGDGCFNGTLDATDPANPVCNGGSFDPLTPGDYLVEVTIPNDALGRPMYKVTKEEDINIFNGDQFVPQIPPPACAGPLHTVDVAGSGTDNYPAVSLFGGAVQVPASTPVDNPNYADAGGSYYEGQQKPLCDTKLVRVSNRRSIAPTFNLFTDVPIPGRFWGLLVDDLNFSSNPQSLLYGEKAGVPFAPVGIYDYTNRLVYTAESDFNGLFDVLLPSTNRISCPTPSGVCAGMYRFVGNDPGTPGQLNTNYNPQFRTIAAEFEAFPGLLVPADLAPTQVGVTIQLPGSQISQAVACMINSSGIDPALATPEFYRIDKPWMYSNASGAARDFTIQGKYFGASQGSVTLGTTAVPILSWNDTQIQFSVPEAFTAGSYPLKITGSNGKSTINGLTFQIVQGFPSTPVLDDFNRSTASTTQDLGANWGNDGRTATIYRITPTSLTGFVDQAQVRGTGNTAWLPTSFGANQEAYFTFTKVSGSAVEQALLLKYNGSSPSNTSATLIEVAYNGTNGTVVVRTKSAGQNLNNAVTQATFSQAFSAGDQLGAQALADGTVIVYRNGAQIGAVNVTTTPDPWSLDLAQGGGRIGMRFNGTTSTNDARLDNFGGGNATRINVYEVGPGVSNTRYQPLPYDPAGLVVSHAIQNALDDAAASAGDDLVVVYPGIQQADRINPRGAYFENLIVTSPVKLQGVGPGSQDGTVAGSILDGSAIGGDTTQADDWRAKIAGLTWVGNQTVYEGPVVSLFAQTETQYGSAFNASVDGFDIRGGDQMGFPTNLNQIGGGNTGLPPNVVTQGGAIYANAYIRYLQITNNVVENNGGAYGTIRIGTPNLPQPDTNQHNEDLRIANNRIIANAGTNLAGGIGLFAGADRYEVAYNDICGNFSAEYGGGISQYGFSPNGKIHDNRIYFNRSYDEGGGVMIAGELPANPDALSPGSGPVDIYNNLIQANLGNDDGGGIRFLMAGNYPMNVYNNMIVNNISTHEGGGLSLNDAPNVRVFNNTIMKNMTTATAVTSTGIPAPAGLSTSSNSQQLQGTLPAGSPDFSNPLLFNNIFWDNRAGLLGVGTVEGLGLNGGPINNWDLGVAGTGDLLSPTNTILQATLGTVVPGSGNLTVDPAVIDMYDTSVSFQVWRTNPNFVGAIMVAENLPATLLGDYHLLGASPAVGAGAASKDVPSYQAPPASLSAPSTDFDGQSRPMDCSFEIGADELTGAPCLVDLSITKTDNASSVTAGSAVAYTIVASNPGSASVSSVSVVDQLPAQLSGATWTCAATAGSSCSAASGSGNINTSVSLASGGSVTFTLQASLSYGAMGTLANTASVALPDGYTDPNTANNSATDTDTITPPALPTLALLDNFNRPNANNLGGNWSQAGSGTGVDLRVNANQAVANQTNDGGQAIWNVTIFGANQGAAFTYANTTVNNTALILKASGGTTISPASFIRVRFQTGSGGQVLVQTTSNGGANYTTAGTLSATFTSNDILSAVAYLDGTVIVYKNGVYVGSVATSFTGGGRIGIQLQTSDARVDNFSGGNLP